MFSCKRECSSKYLQAANANVPPNIYKRPTRATRSVFADDHENVGQMMVGPSTRFEPAQIPTRRKNNFLMRGDHGIRMHHRTRFIVVLDARFGRVSHRVLTMISVGASSTPRPRSNRLGRSKIDRRSGAGAGMLTSPEAKSYAIESEPCTRKLSDVSGLKVSSSYFVPQFFFDLI